MTVKVVFDVFIKENFTISINIFIIIMLKMETIRTESVLGLMCFKTIKRVLMFYVFTSFYSHFYLFRSMFPENKIKSKCVDVMTSLR